MQCPDCRSEVLGWPVSCPHCQTSLQSFSNLTASEKPQALSLRLTRAVRLILVTIALVILATAVRLNYGGGKQTEGRSVLAQTKASPSPTPLPPSTAIVPPDETRELATVERAASHAPPKATAPIAGRESTEPAAAPIEEAGVHAAGADEAVPPKINATKPASAAAEAAGEEIGIEPPDPTITDSLGLLTVKSYTRARIYIDGQFSGVTPRTIKLLAGEHSLSLMADGYEEWKRKVRLRGREQVGVLASMNKKAVTAELSSNP